MEYLSAQIKMADASSSGKEIEENPIETAISRGASLSEPAKASISRKRKIIVKMGNIKRVVSTIFVATFEHYFGFGALFKHLLGIFGSTFLAFWEHNLERPTDKDSNCT